MKARRLRGDKTLRILHLGIKWSSDPWHHASRKGAQSILMEVMSYIKVIAYTGSQTLVL
jgi:hypothetical protein